jgi:hypothetical protein
MSNLVAALGDPRKGQELEQIQMLWLGIFIPDLDIEIRKQLKSTCTRSPHGDPDIGSVAEGSAAMQIVTTHMSIV